jgi:hypothetical protein
MLLLSSAVFSRRTGVLSRLSVVMSRSSTVRSRLSGENHVHPPCCRVFRAKIAFIRRVVAFIRVWPRLSAENRVYPAKIMFFRRIAAMIVGLLAKQ